MPGVKCLHCDLNIFGCFDLLYVDDTSVSLICLYPDESVINCFVYYMSVGSIFKLSFYSLPNSSILDIGTDLFSSSSLILETALFLS